MLCRLCRIAGLAARAALLLASPIPSTALAQTDDAAELARKLQNPIAAHTVLPLQSDYDRVGPGDRAWQYTLTAQPVVPFTINRDWNLISRTVMSVGAQHDIRDDGTHAAFGDMLQSFFFSPQAPTAGGWIWGVGPDLLLPTATKGAFSNEKWGAGPTGAILRQEHGWTYGVLVHHIWSFAGSRSQPHVSATYMQPVLAYTTARDITYAINSESTYDWREKQWTAPINASVARLVHVGDQPLQFELGYRYYVDKPADGPRWGLRFTVTLIIPK